MPDHMGELCGRWPMAYVLSMNRQIDIMKYANESEKAPARHKSMRQAFGIYIYMAPPP